MSVVHDGTHESNHGFSSNTTTEQNARAASALKEAFREDDIYRTSSIAALAVRSVLDRPPEKRPTEAHVLTSLATAFANGWDQNDPERFAGRLGLLTAVVQANDEMLEQLTLRTTAPERVDHRVVIGLSVDSPEDRRWAYDKLDAELADPVAMADRRALAAGQLHAASVPKQQDLAARLQDPANQRVGSRTIQSFRRHVSMEEQSLQRHRARVDPIRHYDAIMKREAAEAIVHVSRMTDAQRREKSRATLERMELERRTTERFGESAMLGYNQALHIRSGTRQPDGETRMEFARVGVASDPEEDAQWRRDALSSARRTLTLEGIPAHLRERNGSSELPTESTYDQEGMDIRIARAAVEMGIGRDMVHGRGEAASLARVLHIHAPHALDIARTGRTTAPSAGGSTATMHEDISVHMSRGDFLETRRDLERMIPAVQKVAHRCSQSTRELLGIGGTERRSQMEALVVEAERRAPQVPEPILGRERAGRGSQLAAALNSFRGHGMT